MKKVELPLVYAGIKSDIREEMAIKALENVGLSDRMSSGNPSLFTNVILRYKTRLNVFGCGLLPDID